MQFTCLKHLPIVGLGYTSFNYGFIMQLSLDANSPLTSLGMNTVAGLHAAQLVQQFFNKNDENADLSEEAVLAALGALKPLMAYLNFTISSPNQPSSMDLPFHYQEVATLRVYLFAILIFKNPENRSQKVYDDYLTLLLHLPYTPHPSFHQIWFLDKLITLFFPLQESNQTIKQIVHNLLHHCYPSQQI